MTDLKEARRTGLEFATGNNPGVGTLILDMVAEIERLRAALTPSVETKAAYMGEFTIPWPDHDEDGNEVTRRVNVPWTTIKEIMAAIRAYAVLSATPDSGQPADQAQPGAGAGVAEIGRRNAGRSTVGEADRETDTKGGFEMGVPDFLVWHCAGCGKAAVGKTKPCDCATSVGFREGPTGAIEKVVFEHDLTKQWNEWYERLPPDLKRRLAVHDFKRLGDLFAEVFNVR